MRKFHLITLLISFFILIFVLSCREDFFVAPLDNGSGDIFVTSRPVGANIFLDGEFTTLKTPSWLSEVTAGTRIIKLSLNGYADTSIAVILRDSTSAIVNVQLIKE